MTPVLPPPPPRWMRLGPLGTVALVFALSGVIIALLFSGLMLFFLLGGMGDSHGGGANPWAYLVAALYFLLLVRAVVSFINGKLWPLLALLGLMALLFSGLLAPLSSLIR